MNQHTLECILADLPLGGIRYYETIGSTNDAAADWIERYTVQNRALITALRRDLDRGEAETIALALELKADLVLLDEKEGRHAAQRLGFQVVGVVGVLLEAKANNALDALRPHLDALRQTAGFYLSESLCRHALELMGEYDK